MKPLIEGKARYDQAIVDFLREHRFRYFDMNLVHVEDYKNFRIPFDQYMKRYFIGHYSPAGNHFFAYAIKDTIVDWLDPKPITTRNRMIAGSSSMATYQSNLASHAWDESFPQAVNPLNQGISNTCVAR